jgi:hypothetical protein
MMKWKKKKLIHVKYYKQVNKQLNTSLKLKHKNLS